MTIKRYNKILVGTDGSSLAGPTVARAATLADTESAELIIVCAYTTMTAREEATLSSVPAQSVKLGQVPGKASASQALDEAMSIAERQGAHVSAAILMDAEPAAALLETGKQFLVDAIVIGAIRDTSIVGGFSVPLPQRLSGAHIAMCLLSARLPVLRNRTWRRTS
ncbi:universal stress protein [Actinobaculum sp. 313]|uniref:universal stress protein n=1 Tax=Actinobaculum sp. 313 TaxID=2495645 RepID=UPI000D527290|nr:universal stress protein [Actinobaculum sp. 313]AWE43050.1 universal stress protein [Actinobaculum sp. 313]